MRWERKVKSIICDLHGNLLTSAVTEAVGNIVEKWEMTYRSLEHLIDDTRPHAESDREKPAPTDDKVNFIPEPCNTTYHTSLSPESDLERGGGNRSRAQEPQPLPLLRRTEAPCRLDIVWGC